MLSSITKRLLRRPIALDTPGSPLHDELQRLDRAVQHLQQALGDVHAPDLRNRVDRLANLEPLTSDILQHLGWLEDARRRLIEWQRVTLTSMLLAAGQPQPTEVGVLMATRNRASLCERAVRSVLAQRHHNWRLVVVADGCTDGTVAMLEALDDDRITVVASSPDGAAVGAAAARNTGLQHLHTDWVTFLDDDNLMDPGWLHAVAVHAADQPSVHAFYGVQIRQHESVGEPVEASMLMADASDLQELRTDNRIDLGALAVRRSSPELHFDASLRRFIDWDLVVRLHDTHGLTPLWAWSGIYTTDAQQRISNVGGDEAIAEFRLRLARTPAE